MKRLILFVVALVLFIPLLALAAGEIPVAVTAGELVTEAPEEITLGQYTIPVLISLFLAIVFNIFAAIGARWKPLIAIGIGVGLGIVAIPYHNQPWTLIVVVDHVFYGIMSGCAAVGLYEGQKMFRKSHR